MMEVELVCPVGGEGGAALQAERGTDASREPQCVGHQSGRQRAGSGHVSQTVNKASLAPAASLAVSCVYTKEVNHQRTVETPRRFRSLFGLLTAVVQIKFSQFEPSSRLLPCKNQTLCQVV